jgi:hypothetical protein
MRRPMLFPGRMPRRLVSGRRQLGLLQMLIMAAALLSALALIWLAHGMKVMQHKIQLPYTAAAMNGAGLQGQGRAVPSSLEFPLWWHAPFVAQSGMHALVDCNCRWACGVQSSSTCELHAAATAQLSQL